jgi:hypothetical protein
LNSTGTREATQKTQASEILSYSIYLSNTLRFFLWITLSIKFKVAVENDEKRGSGEVKY